jgi:hypothetical protein
MTQLKRPGRPPTPHRFEELVDAAVELFFKRVDQGVEFFSVGGRPMFTTKLTEREELERYNDPLMRQETYQQLLQLEGSEAAEEWLRKMEVKLRSPF